MEADLIIFDCDGVLIDSEVISARMLIAELALHGVEMDLDFVARHFLGRSYPVVLAEVRGRWGVALPERFEADYRARLLAAFGRDLRAMAGAAEAVAALRLPCCLATSSSPPRLARSLEITGLAPLFAGRAFTSGEVARGKPAPDLFLHAAARMGADPARVVVIEDSVMGLMAARAAGMAVWHFTGGSHFAGRPPVLPEGLCPDRSFPSFAAMRAAVPGLFGAPAPAPVSIPAPSPSPSPASGRTGADLDPVSGTGAPGPPAPGSPAPGPLAPGAPGQGRPGAARAGAGRAE